MGFLMKVAAADWNALRGHADITSADQLGRDGASYTEGISKTLRALHDLHRQGRISDEDYNKYRTEFVGAVDPQQVYEAYRSADASRPNAKMPRNGRTAFMHSRQFYVDAVNRGLMTPEQAQAQLNKIKTGAPTDPANAWRKKVKPIQDPAKNAQGLTFSYRPGTWVDTRTGQPVTAPLPRKKKKRRARNTPAAPANPAAPVAPLPVTPAVAPIDLSGMTADTLRDIPGVTRETPASLTLNPQGVISPQTPNVNVLAIRSGNLSGTSDVAPAPAPASAPVVSPGSAPRRPARRQHTYEDALNNGWSADAANTYGRGWVYRDNGDGTRTYRSPSQIKKLDPKAVRGGITVDAPKKAADPKPQPSTQA